MKTHYTDNGYTTACKKSVSHARLHTVNDWSRVECKFCLRHNLESVDKMQQAKLKSISVVTADGQTVEIPVRELEIAKGGFVYKSICGDLFIPLGETFPLPPQMRLQKP